MKEACAIISLEGQNADKQPETNKNRIDLNALCEQKGFDLDTLRINLGGGDVHFSNCLNLELKPHKDVDADSVHHITDRKLMSNDGYAKENGISLCELCHKRAEELHVTEGRYGWEGYFPEQLYELINSSKEMAIEMSEKLT